MKITFTCKLKMTDEFEDTEVETVYPADEVAKELASDLREGLSEKGIVEISDFEISIH